MKSAGSLRSHRYLIFSKKGYTNLSTTEKITGNWKTSNRVKPFVERVTIMSIQYSRRVALKTLAAAPWAVAASSPVASWANQSKPLPVAAVITEYRNNSHADVIVGKILEGFKQDGGPGPGLKLASLYVDQFPKNDMSRELSRKYGFPITKTIEEAITLGSNQVQVAGVLSIGEHGNYPLTPETKQRMYPRRRFFDAISATFRKCGQVVPVFNDKHLAYNWADSKHMYDTAQKMKIPFMAGSSLPVTWRLPARELPVGSVIEEALGIGYGGLEAYGFHALETFQCVTERRRGGETGVKAVQAVRGEQIWQSQQAGRWSQQLLQAALAAAQIKVTEQEFKTRLNKESAFYLIDYRDGLRGTVAMVNGVGGQFGIALKLRGQDKPFVNWFKTQQVKPFMHFAELLKGIERMIRTREPVYPVERTLLTGGILDRAIHSFHQEGKRLETPELAIRYQPTDWGFANRDGNNPLPAD